MDPPRTLSNEGTKMPTTKTDRPRCRGILHANPWRGRWAYEQCRKRAKETIETSAKGVTVQHAWCGDDDCAHWIRSGRSSEWK